MGQPQSQPTPDPEAWPTIDSIPRESVCDACWESLQMWNGQISRLPVTIDSETGKLCFSFHTEA